MPGRLHRFLIRGDQIALALRDLYQMNIRPSTVYPDLVGAAQDANVAHTMIGSAAGIRRSGLVS
jgi:hypothetical protein